MVLHVESTHVGHLYVDHYAVDLERRVRSQMGKKRLTGQERSDRHPGASHEARDCTADRCIVIDYDNAGVG
jgi:hypothetical protein